MRSAIAIAIAATSCYHVALSPDARGRIERVVVVVGRVPPVHTPESVNMRSPVIHGERWSLYNTVRRALIAELATQGWQAEGAAGTEAFSTGALFDAPWPEDLCTHGGTVLWAVPYLTWRPGVASGVGEIDLIAQLVACPEGELLWRDRIIRDVTLYHRGGVEPRHTVGPDEVDLHFDAAERVINTMVVELLASLK